MSVNDNDDDIQTLYNSLIPLVGSLEENPLAVKLLDNRLCMAVSEGITIIYTHLSDKMPQKYCLVN